MKPALKKFLALAVGGGWLVSALAQEVIPPKPAHYFNDYAGVVAAGTAAQLEAQLAQFERDTANQILVAVYPKMQSESAVDDYTVRIANAWQVGQRDKRNGAVLFVFVQEHKMFIQVGYGLEGPLPDATCKDIVEDVIKPHFKSGDYDGGLVAGVAAILAATKGEYHGTGQTVAEREQSHQPGASSFITVIIIFILLALILSRSRGGSGLLSTAGWILTSSGGSNWSGGRGGGGGGFSSGGGSFGGGGAGGSW